MSDETPLFLEDPELLESFLTESDELTQALNSCLLEGEEALKGNNTLSSEKINEMFRSAHTIKGTSAFLGLPKINSLTHEMETLLDRVREGKMPLSLEIIDVLFFAFDLLESLLSKVRDEKNEEIDIDLGVQKIKSLLEKGLRQNVAEPPPSVSVQVNVEPPKASSSTLIQNALYRGMDVFRVMVVIQKDVPIKSAKAALIEERIKKFGELLVIDPQAASIEDDEKQNLILDLTFASTYNEKDIRKNLTMDQVQVESIERLQREDNDPLSPATPLPNAPIDPSKPSSGAPQPQQEKSSRLESTTVRIDIRKLDYLMNMAGELVITKARLHKLKSYFDANARSATQSFHQVSQLGGLLSSARKELKKVLSQDEKKQSTGDVSIVEVLENVGLGLDELGGSYQRSGLLGLIRSFEEMTNSLGQISIEIQNGIMQARMVPIEGVFSRFRRVIRDLSHELGKDVQLIVTGEDTELDKKIIDELGNPLMHMVRNALDHGIESPAVRKKAGKPPQATLRLSAAHRGNNVCIEIGDDGKGLDAEKIAAKAVEKGLLTAEQASRLSPTEKVELIFSPGFSTVDQVTALSGRGVGMDVVKYMIEGVGGSIEIQTVVGKGSTFVLNIPLTLAIIQALLVERGEQPYAIPINSVTEILRIPKKEIHTIDGNDTITLRDHVLSLVTLEKTLQTKDDNVSDDGIKKVVVVNDGVNQLGVVVDNLIGEEEIVIKALSEHFANVKGISGASVLGDGRIALILDTVAIIKEAR